MRIRRTLDIARREIQSFFDEHGRRPVVKEMDALDVYMRRRHKSSLKKMCETMGLPKRKKKTKYNWTLEDANQIVQTFYVEKGYRPTHTDLPELDGWLRYHFSTTVCAVANGLGIPGIKRNRTLEGAREEVQRFYDEKKFRPTAKDMMALNNWLTTKCGTSVSKICEELKIPGGRNHARTMKNVRDKVRAFFKKHGRRPTKSDYCSDDAWLKHRGTSLSALCDKMDMPPARSQRKSA